MEHKFLNNLIFLSQQDHSDSSSQTSATSTCRSNLATIIEGKHVILAGDRFIDDAQIEITIDETPFLYNRTKKEYQGKCIFSV